MSLGKDKDKLDTGRDFLESLVQKMGTCFSSPEEILMVQGEYNPHIYFIINGECVVFQRGFNRREKIIGILVEGNIVGEISTLYRTARTATVMNKNYTTLARISH